MNTSPPVDAVSANATTPALVVGFDRSAASDAALAAAVDLAGRLSATLHVVHGIDDRDYPVDPDLPDWEERAATAVAELRERAEQVLRPTTCTWDYHSDRGDPAALLDRVAEEHDALMIVVGGRGGGVGAAIDRFLDGSVSRSVLRHRHRPVLVVPPPE